MQLGNPLLDIEISVQDADYLWSHGVISDEMLVLKKAVCNDSKYILEQINHNLSKACAEVFRELGDEVGGYTDTGDLLMPICQSLSAIEQSISYRFHADLHAKVGGWSQSFGQLMKGKSITYLTFATVKGAAHEVPFTSPSQALTLFRSFLSGSPLPRMSMA